MSECMGPGCPTCGKPQELPQPQFQQLREIVAAAYKRMEEGE